MIRLVIILLMFFSSLLAAQTDKIEYSKYHDKAVINKADKSVADSIYNFVKNELSFIDHDDCNNCHSRAHLIAAIIENKFPGVSIAKVWLFGDSKRATQKEKYRYKPDLFLSIGNDCRYWGYHVAPVIIIENELGTDTIIIDPSTQSEPASISEWALNLLPPDGKGFIVFKDRKYYFFPRDSDNKFEDHKAEWTDEQTNLFDDDYSRSIDDIISSRYTIYDPAVYNTHLRKIREMLK